MTVMALSGTFHDFSKVADRHVSRARPKVAFARTVVGHLLDGVGSFVLNGLNTSLERDVVRMRGLRASLAVLDRDLDVLDPDQECIHWLEKLEQKVIELQGEVLKAKCDPWLKKSHLAVCRTAELCGQLHEAVVELRVALTEHDAKAAYLAGSSTLVYELTERQAEQLEECKMSERQPTARMREAGRRYSELVTSR